MIGIGGVGHIELQLLGLLGSGTLVAVDTDERRRRLASELGADLVVDSQGAVEAVREVTDGRAPISLSDFVGSDVSRTNSMDVLARGGTFSVVGYGGMLCADTSLLVANEHTVMANLVGTWADLFELLELHVAGAIVLRTERYRLDEVNEVLGRLRAGEVVGRAVLVPG